LVEATRRDGAAGLDPGEDGSARRHGLPMPEVCGDPIHVADRAELEVMDQRLTHGGALLAAACRTKGVTTGGL
jgi:hypothetical protein